MQRGMPLIDKIFSIALEIIFFEKKVSFICNYKKYK